MAEKRVSVRLVAEGGRQVRAELEGIGDAGSKGFGRLSREMELANTRLAAFARRAGIALAALTAAAVRIAQVQPLNTTKRYHAIARGDTTVQGNSSYLAPNGQPQWIDVRVAVGASIAIELYVDGVLQSAASAANTQAKGKPIQVVFANVALHGSVSSRIWSYAHLAVLDGVSTIGRRFVRRTPNAVATFNQMAGSIDALRDEDIASRVTSSAAGQRLSFSLAGPTGPAAVSAIAGVHVKQIAQGGTVGPQATAGFLRMAGVNHDAPSASVPTLVPKPVYSSWALNPTDNSAWTSVTLPTEVGILSA
jgi:hypothetical protein